MKKQILIMLLAIMPVYSLIAQNDVQTSINNASDFYKAKNYKQAQNSLQEAMNEISRLMGLEVLKQLPTAFGDIKANTDNDEVNVAAGFGLGTSVKRSYANDGSSKSVEISVTGNSSLLASVNALSGFGNMYGGGTNVNKEKTVVLGSHSGKLKWEKTEESYDDNGTEKTRTITDYTLTVTMGSSIVEVKGLGFANEQEFTAIYKAVNFDNVAKALGE
jgi:hypothetical protein